MLQRLGQLLALSCNSTCNAHAHIHSVCTHFWLQSLLRLGSKQRGNRVDPRPQQFGLCTHDAGLVGQCVCERVRMNKCKVCVGLCVVCLSGVNIRIAHLCHGLVQRVPQHATLLLGAQRYATQLVHGCHGLRTHTHTHKHTHTHTQWVGGVSYPLHKEL
jgi:hypothetical protein